MRSEGFSYRVIMVDQRRIVTDKSIVKPFFTQIQNENSVKIGIILGRFSGMSVFELSLDPHSPGTWPGVRSLDLSNVKYNTAEGHAEDPWCSSSTKARCQTKACPWIAVHRLGPYLHAVVI